MGLFAEIISNDELELEIPEGHSLTLTNAVLEPLKKGKKDDESVLLYVQTTNEEDSILLGRYSNSNSGPFQSMFNVKFGPEDGTIKLWTPSDSGKIHVTGIWTWEDEDDHPDDEEEDDDEVEEDEGEETAEEMYCEEITPPVVVKPVVVEQIKNNKKDKIVNKIEEIKIVESSSNSNKRERIEESKKSKESKKNKKVKETEEAITLPSSVPTNAASIKRTKTWKISPSNDEGIKVPLPKSIKKDGIEYTDYIIGKGNCPKLGANISITYEGSFAEGEIFDSKLKTTAPFKFRKGIGMVIKGLDLGLEDMRIGGAREIIIPAKLGYGKDGVGNIPGNQTLVFRVNLIA